MSDQFDKNYRLALGHNIRAQRYGNCSLALFLGYVAAFMVTLVIVRAVGEDTDFFYYGFILAAIPVGALIVHCNSLYHRHMRLSSFFRGERNVRSN